MSVLNDRRPFALYSLILGGFLFLSFISRFSSPLGGCFSWFFCSMGFLTITFQVSWPLHKTAALLTGAIQDAGNGNDEDFEAIATQEVSTKPWYDSIIGLTNRSSLTCTMPCNYSAGWVRPELRSCSTKSKKTDQPLPL